MVLGNWRDGSLVNLYLLSMACGVPTKRQLPNSCKWDCACTNKRAYWGLALHCPRGGEEIWVTSWGSVTWGEGVCDIMKDHFDTAPLMGLGRMCIWPTASNKFYTPQVAAYQEFWLQK